MKKLFHVTRFLLLPWLFYQLYVPPELWTPELGETLQVERAYHMQAHATVLVLTVGPRTSSIFFGLALH